MVIPASYETNQRGAGVVTLRLLWELDKGMGKSWMTDDPNYPDQQQCKA